METNDEHSFGDDSVTTTSPPRTMQEEVVHQRKLTMELLDHFSEVLKRDERSRKRTMKAAWAALGAMRDGNGMHDQTMARDAGHDSYFVHDDEEDDEDRQHMEVGSALGDTEVANARGKLPATSIAAAQALATHPQGPTSLTLPPAYQLWVDDETLKPPFSFMTLVGKAILSSPGQRMTCYQIYVWIHTNFAFYRKKNLVMRRLVSTTLSNHKDVFAKVKGTRGAAGGHKAGPGGYWMVQPIYAANADEDPLDRVRYALYLQRGG